MSSFKQSTTKGILIASVSLALVACASAPQPKPQSQPPLLYDDAHKMNSIEIGMTTEQVQGILGKPRSSLANSYGFRCAEFALLKHTENFRSSRPNTFFVMFRKGAVIETGEMPCSVEMGSSNFQSNPTFKGKYGRLID